MPGDDPRPASRRRWLRRGAAVVVLLLVASAAVVYELDLWPGRAGAGRGASRTPSGSTPASSALRLPAVGTPAPVAPVTTTQRSVDRAEVRRTLAPLVGADELGSHVVVRVAALLSGRVVYRHGDGAVRPASTMKLLTTTAALSALGPDHRFTTRVVAAHASREVVLVGGGDPLLARRSTRGDYPARASLEALAAATARALRGSGHHRVRLGYDASLFTGPAVDPHWEPDYVPEDVVSPISALWADEGRTGPDSTDRDPDPALAAARAFAHALGRHGVDVRGTPEATRAPQGAARTVLALVRSAPLAQIVQHVLEVSDNEGAEVLAHQVAVARGEPASFAGAVRAVRAVLAGLGVSTRGERVYDGSGLSRQDRLTTSTLLAVIRTDWSRSHPGLRSAVADLPVAGFTGSLAARFDRGDPLARGVVRAKTGTLTGVHALAGTLTTRDGAVLEFAAVADRVAPEDSLDARAALDRLVGSLAGCRCTRSATG